MVFAKIRPEIFGDVSYTDDDFVLRQSLQVANRRLLSSLTRLSNLDA